MNLRSIIREEIGSILHGKKSSNVEYTGVIIEGDEINKFESLLFDRLLDLGVEIPLEQVPLAQQKIIDAGLMRGMVVIVATQMLESMTLNPRPTRAEVSDVANAIYDGTDAIMLSGESAIGKYAVESVEVIIHILCQDFK